MINWYRSVGGKSFTEEYWDYKGHRKELTFVGYGRGKYCHYRKDGTVGVRLHFNEEDASVASLFIMTFDRDVEAHNFEAAHFN
jgi:hypothetical protein